MATKFTGDVGYRGIVRIGNGAGEDAPDVTLLATGGNVNLGHNPIFSSGVWGAGYQNASEQVAYANNYLQLDGSISCEFTAGDGFEAINNIAFVNRGNADGTHILILPNGEHGFTGFGWCTSLSFSQSQDSILNGDMNWSSYIDGNRNEILYCTTYDTDQTDGDILGPGSGETNGNYLVGADNTPLGQSNGELPMEYNALYPYWATKITDIASDGSGTPVVDVVNWSASYSSSVEFLKCCATGRAEYDTLDTETVGLNAPLAPDYIILGSMTAEGSYTIFKLANKFAPNSYHEQMGLEFLVRSPKDTQGYSILLPKIIRSSGSTSVQTGSSYITADFSFTAIGDGKNPPLSLQRGTTLASNP